MKSLFIVVFMFVALNSWATDYIIVRNGDQTTIYQHTVSSNDNVYLGVFPLNNPSVDMLKQIGLPTHLWGRLNLSDGIYDTRLDEYQQQLFAANGQLEDDKLYIQELKSERGSYRFLTVVFGIIILIMALILITNKSKR